MHFSFNSDYAVDTVHLIYLIGDEIFIDKLNNTHDCLWTVDLYIENTKNLLYGFLINQTYWIPDFNRQTKNVNGLLYSLYNSKHIGYNKVDCVNGYLCKDFSEDLSQPIDITTRFTSNEKFICLWTKLKVQSKEEIIYLQLISPELKIQIFEFYVIGRNEKKDEVIFYAALPINYQMKSGNWKIRLMSTGKCIYDKDFTFINLVTNNKVTFNTNHRFDLKV